MTEESFRHEYKYLLSENALRMFEGRIKGIMKRDIHTGEDGRYMIRSIYFDDMYYSCYRENEDGTDIKEKFRIRAYNADDSFISLELKRKEHGKTQKLSEIIDKELYDYLVYDKPIKGFSRAGTLAKTLIMQKKTRLMKPKIIVQYEREPFIYERGNVRVTFDRFISSSPHIDRMFEKDAFCLPSLPEGIHLLEVKWDEFLPEEIRIAIENSRLQSTAFSKYYLGMQMTGNTYRFGTPGVMAR
ncbi:MAG: polyphosphate polymerase domain-containing protein [Lachnospiraceae bacterium]|nr:polyphosphate polymerase domain-containing protein [Lachnospiraceae bacterium]